jgi:hypothetical protein
MRTMLLVGGAQGLALSLVNGVRGEEPDQPTAPASEAHPAVPAAGHSVHGEAFNDGPRHRAYLMPGMGKVNFPVTTAQPEAQAFINQGVAQLHYIVEKVRKFSVAGGMVWIADLTSLHWRSIIPGSRSGTPWSSMRIVSSGSAEYPNAASMRL